MNNFTITLSDDVFEVEKELTSLGEIKIGNVTENFHCPLSYWNEDNYYLSWEKAFEYLKEGNTQAAFVTSMRDPKTANFIIWWVVYIIEDDAYIQNHILMLDELDNGFDENNIFSYIPERETCTDDGDRISEWKIPLSKLLESVTGAGLLQRTLTGSPISKFWSS